MIKKAPLSRNSLKLIAIIAMTLDHIALLFLPPENTLFVIFRTLGRVTAPLMCFFIAEGFKFTSDRKKYLLRLFIFSVISHFPYALYMNEVFSIGFFKITSVIWSLALGYIALWVCSNKKTALLLKILTVAVCCVLSYPSDYNIYPVILILFFGLLRTNFFAQILSYLVITFGVYMLPIILRNHHFYIYWLGFLLTIPLLMMYNRKKGKKTFFSKWLFYIYYPLHLLILWFISVIFCTV